MSWKVFWLEPTDLVRVSLRRFTYERDKRCRERKDWGHDASVVIVRDALRHIWQEQQSDGYWSDRQDIVSEDDPRWPAVCDTCDEPFQLDDEFQLNADLLYHSSHDGNLYTLRDAPIGAMWDAHWLRDGFPEPYTGPDGLSLAVRTPGGDWLVDAECSNCTRPQWQAVPGQENTRRWAGRSHYCWPRKGDPRSGCIDVAKEHGPSCEAGAGSIVIGGYHGFLRHGFLTHA